MMHRDGAVEYAVRRKPLPQAHHHSHDLRYDREEAIPLVSVTGRHSIPLIEPGNATSNTPAKGYQRLSGPFQDEQPTYQELPPPNDPSHAAESIASTIVKDHNNGYPEGNNGHGKATQITHGPLQAWNSRWLHTATLLGLALLFLAMLVALVLLAHFANSNNGLSTQLSSNHYSWTYGPTALLVLVLSAWKQVDFNCRILAPWKHAAAGASDASHSLLLDYVSPILPSIVWSAARKRDWAVLAGSLGVGLLRLVIVFSTGLLVLSPTLLIENTNFVADTKFVGTTPNSDSPKFGDQALETYYGVWRQELDYPYGSAATFAYETIDVRSTMANSTITATVNGFYPEFDCETTPLTSNISWVPNSDKPGLYDLDLQYTADPPGCPRFHAHVTTVCQPLTASTPGDCPARTVLSDFIPWASNYDILLLNHSSEDVPEKCGGFWFWTLAEISYRRVTGVSANTTSGWDIEYSNMVGLTCYPSYSIRPLNVTMDINNDTQIAKIHYSEPWSQGSSLFNYSATNFSQDLTNEDINTGSQYAYNDSLAILLIPNASLTESDLLDAQVLKEVAVPALKGYAAQMVHQILRQDEHRSIIGTTVYSQQRLQVLSLSVWLMSGGFVALVLCTAAILRFRAHDVISRDPSSIATNAAILAASPSLDSLISQTSQLSDKNLRMTTHNLTVHSAVTSSSTHTRFSIQVHSPDGQNSKSEVADSKFRKWWTPMSIGTPFMTWVITIPIAIIVVLEILQRFSDTHHGIANIYTADIASHFAASIVSSFLMILIATSYDSIDFAISTFGPYQTLSRGRATVKQSLLQNSVGQLPILSIIDAVRRRRPLVAIASFAATIASLLTIITSGLYTLESVPYTSSVNLSSADHFTTYWNSSKDNGAGTVFGLIEHENATYPSYTYNELVFPRLATDFLQSGNRDSGTLVQLSIPARRAALNCTIIPQDNITTQTIAQGSSTGPLYSTEYLFVAGVPDSCPEFRNLSDVPITSIPFQYGIGWAVPNNTEVKTQFAEIVTEFDFSFGYSNNTVYWDGIGAESNAPGCPSLAFVYGLFDQQNKTTETISGMLCVQGLQHVQTNTTFVLPDMTIPMDAPPIVYEDTAVWITAEDYIESFLGPSETFRSFNTTAGTFDNFYQTVLWGTDGIPFEELLGVANTEKLVNATQHVYRKYMAQVINNNMRVPYANENASTNPVYRAQLPDSIHRLRLVQNSTSKIILQLILGIMLLCAIVVYISSRELRRLLPRCPWSMAGMMTLLAGSELCERKVMPEGAEFMTDKELQLALQGWLFSLGWWGEGEEERYGIDVGEARRERKRKSRRERSRDEGRSRSRSREDS